jgi:CheY-like chemotaxis protein
MDGWAVLSAMKAEPELADIPVIMVSFVQQKGLAFSLGAADYLTKPVQWTRLKEVLDRYRSPGSALVMEADPDSRTELRRLLEAEGWTVEEAADRPPSCAAWRRGARSPAWCWRRCRRTGRASNSSRTYAATPSGGPSL